MGGEFCGAVPAVVSLAPELLLPPPRLLPPTHLNFMEPQATLTKALTPSGSIESTPLALGRVGGEEVMLRGKNLAATVHWGLPPPLQPWQDCH